MPVMFGGPAGQEPSAPATTKIPVSGRPVPVASSDQGSRPPQRIDLSDATPVDGPPTPPPQQPPSPEQVLWGQRLAASINTELSIYHSCFMSVRRMTADIMAGTPLDAADIGNAQWGKGSRTPLENAEPEIALEVYRQVKREMRAEERREADKDAQAVRRLLGKARG